MCRMKVMVRLRPSLYETYKSERRMVQLTIKSVIISSF